MRAYVRPHSGILACVQILKHKVLQGAQHLLISPILQLVTHTNTWVKFCICANYARVRPFDCVNIAAAMWQGGDSSSPFS